MPLAPQSFAPGTVVAGRYRIEGLLGAGGFGAVYRATQLNLDRAVAIKVLLPDVFDGDGAARFKREAELVQRLEHPNTVRLLDFGSHANEAPFLVFELLKGHTLEEVIRADGPMPPARVARIAAQILKALMEAHGLGIVHRDIKPGNVFLCNFQGEPDFVKVIDFGIAKGSDAGSGASGALTRRGHVVGTPAYMAPEMLLGDEAAAASDLFALGLLMSEALAGKPVFEGSSGAEIARAQVSPAAVPHAPEVLRSPLGPVIHRATQKQAERRHPSAAEMLAHLDAVMRTAPATGGLGLIGSLVQPAHDSHSPTGAPFPAIPTGTVSAVTAGPRPLVPPAPGPRAKRSERRFVWIGGIAVAALALGGIGVAVSSGARGGRGGAARPGAEKAGAPGIEGLIGGSYEFVEAAINGDAVPDFVAFCVDPAPKLCAFDGATFEPIWRVPVVAGQFLNSTFLTVTGSTLTFIDAAAKAHLLDVKTGAEIGTLRLPGVVHEICTPRAEPQTIWIKTQDNQRVRIDTASRSVVAGSDKAERPGSCKHQGFQMDKPAGGKSLTYRDVLLDGSAGVGVGEQDGSRSVMKLFGFTQPAAGARAVRWSRPVAPDDGFGGRVDGAICDIAAGRMVIKYEDLTGNAHILAVDVASGKTLWDVDAENQVASLVLSATRVYANGWRQIDVRDAATGRRIGRVGTALPKQRR